jgi:hypothetical protein
VTRGRHGAGAGGDWTTGRGRYRALRATVGNGFVGLAPAAGYYSATHGLAVVMRGMRRHGHCSFVMTLGDNSTLGSGPRHVVVMLLAKGIGGRYVVSATGTLVELWPRLRSQRLRSLIRINLLGLEDGTGGMPIGREWVRMRILLRRRHAGPSRIASRGILAVWSPLLLRIMLLLLRLLRRLLLLLRMLEVRNRPLTWIWLPHWSRMGTCVGSGTRLRRIAILILTQLRR